MTHLSLSWLQLILVHMHDMVVKDDPPELVMGKVDHMHDIVVG